MRGRASTLQVSVKCNFLFFSAAVKLIPFIRKRKKPVWRKSKGWLRVRVLFSQAPVGKKKKKKESKMSLTGSSPVLYMY